MESAGEGRVCGLCSWRRNPNTVLDVKGSSQKIQPSLIWKDQEETYPGPCYIVEKLPFTKPGSIERGPLRPILPLFVIYFCSFEG